MASLSGKGEENLNQLVHQEHLPHLWQDQDEETSHQHLALWLCDRNKGWAGPITSLPLSNSIRDRGLETVTCVPLRLAQSAINGLICVTPRERALSPPWSRGLEPQAPLIQYDSCQTCTQQASVCFGFCFSLFKTEFHSSEPGIHSLCCPG